MDERQDPSESARLVDRYVIGDEIAAGGMGVVHVGGARGSHGFSRVVAIKRAHRALLDDPGATKAFVDEARLSSRISHVNVASMIDVVEDAGEVFLVMEYIHGASIARVMTELKKRGHDMPIDIAVSLATGVLRGLHAAHHAVDEQGRSLEMIHRDVSPGNVMIDASGVPKLIDFGIAKAVGRSRVTATGEIKGKIAYMAPEQLEGNATSASDVYGASVVLWEMLAGRRMFAQTEGDLDAVLARILYRDRESPETYRSALPEGLAEIVLRGVAIAHEDRFANALEMAAALEASVAPISSARIGEWMAPYVKELLDERAAQIAGLEALEKGLRANDETKTEPLHVARRIKSKRLSPISGMLAAILVVLSLLGAMLVVWSKDAGEDLRSNDARKTPLLMATASTAPFAPQASGSSSAIAELPSPSPIASDVASARSRALSEPRHARASACNPPFTISDAGVKHFVPECFRVH